MYQEKGLYIKFAKAVKEAVDVPVICAGRMDDPFMAAKAVSDGACDIISLGRPLLADPDYVNKLKADKLESIRPCLSCQEGCMGRIHAYGMLNCAVNPAAGRERAERLVPALQAKKILVIGGGPAGCEAARVLKLRGHSVTLCEKKPYLGGNLNAAGVPDFKEDDRALIKWYEHELGELGVDVKLGTEVTPEMAKAYDAVVVATGSRPKMFSLGDNSKVFAAETVLMGEADPGDNVIIVGGGLVGCETALWLAQKGKKVTIVEALPKILAVNAPLCHANADMLEELIPYNGIDVCAPTLSSKRRRGAPS
jgi:2-enoate reductase